MAARARAREAGAVNRTARIAEGERLIVRALRHCIERGDFTVGDAADIAMVQLGRAGGPLPLLSPSLRGDARAALHALAQQLDPTAPRSILAFAREAATLAWGAVPLPRHPGAEIRTRAVQEDTRALARAAIFAETLNAKGSDDLVARAVTRAVRERGRARRGGLSTVRVEEDAPLRALLDLPSQGRVLLPRNDLRARIAAAAPRGSALGGLLREVAVFAEELIRPALGEELWAIGRPVGFSDKRQTRVLVEARSSSHAQELQLRSSEIVTRLRTLRGFERVVGVRVQLAAPSALPVVPRPR